MEKEIHSSKPETPSLFPSSTPASGPAISADTHPQQHAGQDTPIYPRARSYYR
ncbi:unnamed protein product [Penicillium roqueforti FM164]|uniref:Genomic scaffold, ProqFM164S01 n=1 Tax=Penicillium roqueforti (strain FM164) TaxID=1365484 RepID=W6PUH4_PENRF|nr:unnamed protein product [Penicillium roqueforti FM164]